MPSKNLNRLLRALAREGLDVTYHNHIYTVRFSDSPDEIANWLIWQMYVIRPGEG